jgi:phosphoribosyl-dephospho-CoA transferase
MLKIPAEYDRDTTSAKFKVISRKVSPCFATRCLCCNQRALMDELGTIMTHMGITIDQKMVAVAWDASYDTVP